MKQAYGAAGTAATSSYERRSKPPQRVPVGGVGFVFDGKPDEDGFVFAGVDFDKAITSTRQTLAPDCLVGCRAH